MKPQGETSTDGAPPPPAPFPWSEVLAFGFGVLRLSPRDLWAMTPREVRAAMDGVYGARAEVPAREEILALMRAFPD